MLAALFIMLERINGRLIRSATLAQGALKLLARLVAAVIKPRRHVFGHLVRVADCALVEFCYYPNTNSLLQQKLLNFGHASIQIIIDRVYYCCKTCSKVWVTAGTLPCLPGGAVVIQ